MTVVVDGQDTLSQIERGSSVTPGAKGVTGYGHGADEPLKAALAFLSLSGEAEAAVRQAIAKLKPLGRRVREKLNIHAHFTFRCSEAVTRRGPIFGFQCMVRQNKASPKAAEREEKKSPVRLWQKRPGLWR